MIKFTAQLNEGNIYGFGLTETNLNRLQFNDEPIFFDFGYAGHPELFGLILYLDQFKTSIEAAENLDVIRECCIPFLNTERGVTVETLRFFPIARSILKKFRETPFWAFETQIQITSIGDTQLFFAGRDERLIEKHLQSSGLIAPQTKRTVKGFGKDQL